MSPKVLALYRAVRLFLLLFALVALLQGHWRWALYALAVRSVLWWIALPSRRLKTGATFGEAMRRSNRETAQKAGLADIALTLARLPGYAGLPARITLLGPAWMTGDRTATALLRRGRKAGPALVRLVETDDERERENAARALVELRPEGYEDHLLPLLSDPVDKVRAVSESALNRHDERPTSDPFLRLARLPEGEAVPDELIDGLRATWGMGSVGERREAIRQVGERGGGAAVDWLLDLMAENSAETVFATKAVRKIDDPRINDALVVQARRSTGLIALAEMTKRGDVRAEPILRDKLRSSGWTTRGYYLGLLAKLPSETAQAEALRWAKSARGLNRLMAADALAYQGGNPEPLRQCARSWNPVTRVYARRSLARLAGRREQGRGIGE